MTDRPSGNVVPLRRGVTPAARTVAALGDTVIDTLFTVGLHLQHLTPAADTAEAQHLRTALDQIDELIRILRNAAYSASANRRTGASARRDVPARTNGASAASAGRLAGDVHELLDQSDFLHDALHRVTSALAGTEERIADACERLAGTDGPRHEDYALTGQRARTSASQCRDFTAQLKALHSYRATGRPDVASLGDDVTVRPATLHSTSVMSAGTPRGNRLPPDR